MLFNLFQSRDIHHRSKHHKERDFLRSVSMLPHMGYDNDFHIRTPQFSRLLSGDIDMNRNPNEYFSSNLSSKQDVMHTFDRLHMDSDDADDEDDDRTPTVERPEPKFP
jgi:hypothetical protein